MTKAYTKPKKATLKRAPRRRVLVGDRSLLHVKPLSERLRLNLPSDGRIARGAVDICGEAIQAQLQKIFAKAQEIAAQQRCVTVMKKHVQLACSVMDI